MLHWHYINDALIRIIFPQSTLPILFCVCACVLLSKDEPFTEAIFFDRLGAARRVFILAGGGGGGKRSGRVDDRAQEKPFIMIINIRLSVLVLCAKCFYVGQLSICVY